MYIKDKKYDKIANEVIDDYEYKSIVKDILDDNDFKKTASIKHHGISRFEHLVKVSYRSYQIAKKKKLDYKSVARGALLHDFYLDGDERNKIRKFLDTFIHPKKVLDVSNKLFKLNEIEKNIIISHMFPLYFAIPKYKESLLVNLIDKIIGGYELIREFCYIFKKNKSS